MTRGCTSAQGKEVGGGERAAAVRRRGGDAVGSSHFQQVAVKIKSGRAHQVLTETLEFMCHALLSCSVCY